MPVKLLNLTMHPRIQLGWKSMLYAETELNIDDWTFLMAIKGQGDPLIVKSSVQCVRGKQGEPGNEAMFMAYHHFRLLVYVYIGTSRECDKWAEYLSLASELQVGHTNYSWNVFIGIWPLIKLLTSFYFTIYNIHYILKLHIKHHCTSPLAYTHCKLKCEKSVNTRLLNTFPTHFQCTGYLHIQMLIQTPHSDSPIIVSNTVVSCIRLIFNPMPWLSTSKFSGTITLPRASIHHNDW